MACIKAAHCQYLALTRYKYHFLERLAVNHPQVEALAYADDLVLGSHDKNKLEEALVEVAHYMDQAHIKINPEKTRFWCSAGLEAPLSFGGEMIQPVSHDHYTRHAHCGYSCAPSM